MKDKEPALGLERSLANGRPSAFLLLHAAPVSLFLLGLLTYWFAIADRYVIFLYGHYGATPFDGRTRSRYWMAGLVASGAVLVLYTASNWFLGRLAGIHYRRYTPPAWGRVWLASAPLLAVGIPLITLTVNQPTLRPSDAAACTAVTLAGLALALSPGQLAAQRPLELGWLATAGLGLVPSLLLLRALELPAAGLAPVRSATLLALGSVAAGILWLLFVSWLRERQRLLRLAAHRLAPRLFDRPPPAGDAAEGADRRPGRKQVRRWRLGESARLLIAAICHSYLLLPLAHHLFLTPTDYRYISTSANFFAAHLHTQLASFLTAAALAWGATYLRQHWPSAQNPLLKQWLKAPDERYTRREGAQ